MKQFEVIFKGEDGSRRVIEKFFDETAARACLRGVLWYENTPESGSFVIEASDVPQLTVGEMRKLLEKYDESVIVLMTVTDEESGEQHAFDILPEIGEGWLPSGAIELFQGEFVSG